MRWCEFVGVIALVWIYCRVCNASMFLEWSFSSPLIIGLILMIFERLLMDPRWFITKSHKIEKTLEKAFWTWRGNNFYGLPLLTCFVVQNIALALILSMKMNQTTVSIFFIYVLTLNAAVIHMTPLCKNRLQRTISLRFTDACICWYMQKYLFKLLTQKLIPAIFRWEGLHYSSVMQAGIYWESIFFKRYHNCHKVVKQWIYSIL